MLFIILQRLHLIHLSDFPNNFIPDILFYISMLTMIQILILLSESESCLESCLHCCE